MPGPSALRPHVVEVITVRPDALEGEAPRLRPDALVCSRVTPALRTAAGHWMEVRLEEGARPLSTSDAGGSPDPGLDVLLQFVDRGEERPEPPGKRMTPVNGSEV